MTPKKIVHFMEADGFPFDQDTFDYLQTNLRLIEKIAALGSETDAYIIQGCIDGGATVSDGWIYSSLFGMLPLQGGVKKAYIILTVSTEDAVFNDGVTTVNATKYSNLLLQFSDTPSGVATLWSDVKRLKNLQTLTNEVDELRSKLLPGNWHKIGASGEPAFQNGWSNVSTNQPLMFKKINYNTVKIHGVIHSGSFSVPVFTLPDGYKPLSQQNAIAYITNKIGYIQIETSGDVKLEDPNSGTNLIVIVDIEFSLDI